MKPIFIYALLDPSTMEARYVGKSVDPQQRIRSHVSAIKREKNKKSLWVETLRRAGLKPVMIYLEIINEGDWQDAERWWIIYLRSIGCSLTNLSSGGCGGSTHSPETIEFLRSRHISEETRAKISKGKKGKKMTADWIEKQRNRRATPETKAKTSATLLITARRWSEDEKKAISDRQKKYMNTPESKARVSALKKGVIYPPEVRARMSAAQRKVRERKANERSEMEMLMMSGGHSTC